MPIPNSPALLLSAEENEVLFNLLARRCQIKSAAVVQVYGTNLPRFDEWHRRFCGVASFTKDSSRRSYFIQVYDMDKLTRVYEQEIYNEMQYVASTTFFHQFEDENEIIGFNFADEQEAENFRSVMHTHIESQRKKREERHANRQHTDIYKIRKGKKPIRKIDIGPPTNFKHIKHVGLPMDGIAGLSLVEISEGPFTPPFTQSLQKSKTTSDVPSGDLDMPTYGNSAPILTRSVSVKGSGTVAQKKGSPPLPRQKPAPPQTPSLGRVPGVCPPPPPLANLQCPPTNVPKVPLINRTVSMEENPRPVNDRSNLLSEINKGNFTLKKTCKEQTQPTSTAPAAKGGALEQTLQKALSERYDKHHSDSDDDMDDDDSDEWSDDE